MKPFLHRCPRFLLIALALALTTTLLVAIQDRLAKPSLTSFDPARMGRLEASMWRNYYEHRWANLAIDGLKVSCGEYGFSWWDGLRTSVLAARSAYHFRGQTDDPRCLTLLEWYYAIIGGSIGREFDTTEAARLELEWWRERRRKRGPEEYAKTIAACAAVLYGLEPADLLEASRRRALAMDYRDHHGRQSEMSEADWEEVARQLVGAFTELKRAISPASPTTPG